LVFFARLGEWTQGSIFDIYLQFAEPGDQYLGRLIVGLDPNSPNFDVQYYLREGLIMNIFSGQWSFAVAQLSRNSTQHTS
jgi:hypothetical protein